MSAETSPPQASENHSAPIVLFTNNRTAAMFWALLAFIGLCAAAVSPYLTINAMKEKEKVIIINRDTGTMVYADTVSWLDQTELSAEIGIQIADLLLARSYSGPGYPLRFNTHLTERVKDRVKSYWQSNEQDMAQKKLIQHLHVASVKPTTMFSEDNNYFADVIIQGTLQKNGEINGVLFQDIQPITLKLRLMRNPDILASGKMPLALYDFIIEEGQQPQTSP